MDFRISKSIIRENETSIWIVLLLCEKKPNAIITDRTLFLLTHIFDQHLLWIRSIITNVSVNECFSDWQTWIFVSHFNFFYTICLPKNNKQNRFSFIILLNLLITLLCLSKDREREREKKSTNKKTNACGSLCPLSLQID